MDRSTVCIVRWLGTTRWSDPSKKLPCHFGRPLCKRGAGTAPPRWGGKTLVQYLGMLSLRGVPRKGSGSATTTVNFCELLYVTGRKASEKWSLLNYLPHIFLVNNLQKVNIQKKTTILCLKILQECDCKVSRRKWQWHQYFPACPLTGVKSKIAMRVFESGVWRKNLLLFGIFTIFSYLII